jgi:hypothetical protein
LTLVRVWSMFSMAKVTAQRGSVRLSQQRVSDRQQANHVKPSAAAGN